MLELTIIYLQKLDVNALIDGRRPIHHAADNGQKEIIEYLISIGADVNVSSFTVCYFILIVICPNRHWTNME